MWPLKGGSNHIMASHGCLDPRFFFIIESFSTIKTKKRTLMSYELTKPRPFWIWKKISQCSNVVTGGKQSQLLVPRLMLLACNGLKPLYLATYFNIQLVITAWLQTDSWICSLNINNDSTTFQWKSLILLFKFTKKIFQQCKIFLTFGRGSQNWNRSNEIIKLAFYERGPSGYARFARLYTSRYQGQQNTRQNVIFRSFEACNLPQAKISLGKVKIFLLIKHLISQIWFSFWQVKEREILEFQNWRRLSICCLSSPHCVCGSGEVMARIARQLWDYVLPSLGPMYQVGCTIHVRPNFY